MDDRASIAPSKDTIQTALVDLSDDVECVFKLSNRLLDQLGISENMPKEDTPKNPNPRLKDMVHNLRRTLVEAVDQLHRACNEIS